MKAEPIQNLRYDFICLTSNDLSFEQRMSRVCQTLADHNYKSLLVGRSLKESRPLPEENFDYLRIKCIFTSGVLFYFELIIRYSLLLRKMSFDNLICVDLDTALVANLILKKNKRFILDLHEWFTEVPELENHWIKRKIWRCIERISAPRFDSIYTVNKSLAKIFTDSYERPVDVVRNIPDHVSFRKRTSSKPIYTCYLGALNPGRGLPELIKTIDGRKGIHLHIIGEGPLRSQLESLSNLSSNIEILPGIAKEDFDQQLSKYHIGWNLLESRSKSYYYSLGNKFFDYALSGIPVITMDFPEYRALNDHYKCAILLEEVSGQNILSAIDAMALDDTSYQSFAMGCKVMSEEISWENESRKLIEILNG